MTIDGTNISTFGMMLSYLSDFFNLAARKKVLSVPGTQEKDIVFEANEATVILIGIYASKADLLTNTEALKALILSNTNHQFVFLGHNLTISGSVMEGMKIDTVQNSVKITFKITIT